MRRRWRRRSARGLRNDWQTIVSMDQARMSQKRLKLTARTPAEKWRWNVARGWYERGIIN